MMRHSGRFQEDRKRRGYHEDGSRQRERDFDAPKRYRIDDDRGRDYDRRRTYEEDDDLDRDRRRSHEGRGGWRDDRRSRQRPSFDECDDWKCFECLTWNYPEDRRCGRCGVPRSPRDDERRHGRHREERSEKSEEAEEMDEFGRVAKKDSKISKPKVVPEWPPNFEKDGSAFVFDSRSGMFYERESDFFYDPKSKMYYSNKKTAYYRHNESLDPPFEQVQTSKDGKPEAINNSLDQKALLNPSKPEHGVEGANKGMMIKLKTKTLKSSKAKQAKQSTEARIDTGENAARVPKQHAKDIDKWSDRQVEKRLEERKIVRTAKGEPMCSLCRRKFATVEKLLHHEKVSKLHKENLAKMSKSQGEEANKYVDRAEQRRNMYCTDVPALAPVELKRQAESMPPQPSPPAGAENLQNESNVGNKLLRKMGWKEGSTLGGRVVEGEGVVGNLKKDWDRIEQMASKGRV